MSNALPILQTSGTSLVLYQRRLPQKYIRPLPIKIEVLPDDDAEYSPSFRDEAELIGYGQHGHLIYGLRKGLVVNFCL